VLQAQVKPVPGSESAKPVIHSQAPFVELNAEFAGQAQVIELLHEQTVTPSFGVRSVKPALQPQGSAVFILFGSNAELAGQEHDAVLLHAQFTINGSTFVSVNPAGHTHALPLTTEFPGQ